MKCLTLTEPWATLVAIGAKQIETRSWPTTYRGPIAIHAAKGMTKADVSFAVSNPAVRRAFGLGVWDSPPGGHWTSPTWSFRATKGKVLAIARLIDVVPTRDALKTRAVWDEPGVWTRGVYSLSDDEIEFGNYEPHRYAWILRDVQRLPEPIPARGALGLWDLDDALLPELAVTR